MKIVAACVAGAFAALVTGLWVTRAEPMPVNDHPADPLQARRASMAPAAPSTRVTEDMPLENRPLLEPPTSGGSNQNAIAAQAVAAAALRENPENVAALSNLGLALLRLNEPGKAIVHFEHAVRIAPDWANQFNLARAHAQLGHWKDAATALQAARTLKPEDYLTSFDLGVALHRSGDDEGAIDEYRRAIALGPHDGSFHRALAISLQRTHRFGDAVHAYQDYLRLSPDASDAEQITQRIARLQAQIQGATPGTPVVATGR
jgi:tetratricopeptide (TPR) repeat protein